MRPAPGGRESGTTEPFSPVPAYPREFELLLCCGGDDLRPRRAARMRELLRDELDWGLVFRLANWHHMLPLLYWNISKLDAPVPPQAMETLKAIYIHNTRQALAMTGELFEITDLLAERDIPMVPYKGPALADRLYGSIALRQSADLDIVVRKADLREVREVLIERGYTPSVMVLGANQDFQVESRYSERFDRPGSTVELHWAFTNKDVAFPLTLDDLLPRLRERVVAGQKSTLVFGHEDTLLILCVHGAKHTWDRLEWICGIAEFIAAREDLDWGALFDTATDTRSVRRLHLGLALAHDLFGVELPDNVERAIRQDEEIKQLIVHVTSAIFDGQRNQIGVHRFGTLEHDLFHYRLADRLADRLRYAIYRMTNPSRPERWSAISIGKRSIPLHVFTRPFGLLARVIRRGFARDRNA